MCPRRHAQFSNELSPERDWRPARYVGIGVGVVAVVELAATFLSLMAG